MDAVEVSEIMRSCIVVAFKLGGPVLILCMAVGVIVAILQAVTQIHEQSIGFLLKLITVVAVLLIGGGWMLEVLLEFSRELFTRMLV